MLDVNRNTAEFRGDRRQRTRASNAVGAFQGAFFLRTHAEGLVPLATSFNSLTGANVGPMVFGPALGFAEGLCGVGGMIIGGWITDKLIRRDAAAYLSVLAQLGIADH